MFKEIYDHYNIVILKIRKENNKKKNLKENHSLNRDRKLSSRWSTDSIFIYLPILGSKREHQYYKALIFKKFQDQKGCRVQKNEGVNVSTPEDKQD